MRACVCIRAGWSRWEKCTKYDACRQPFLRWTQARKSPKTPRSLLQDIVVVLVVVEALNQDIVVVLVVVVALSQEPPKQLELASRAISIHSSDGTQERVVVIPLVLGEVYLHYSGRLLALLVLLLLLLVLLY